MHCLCRLRHMDNVDAGTMTLEGGEQLNLHDVISLKIGNFTRGKQNNFQTISKCKCLTKTCQHIPQFFKKWTTISDTKHNSVYILNYLAEYLLKPSVMNIIVEKNTHVIHNIVPKSLWQ